MKRKRKVRKYLVNVGRYGRVDVPPDVLERYGLDDGSTVEIVLS